MKSHKNIHVFGLPQILSKEEQSIIDNAELVITSEGKYGFVQIPDGMKVLDWSIGFEEVCGAISKVDNAVVLTLGDPGFFGIVRKLQQQFRGENIKVHPSASMVSRAFGAIGMAWTDAIVVSTHNKNLKKAIALARSFPKVAIFTDKEDTYKAIYEGVADLGKKVIVAANLGLENEQIGEYASRQEWGFPNLVIVLDEGQLHREESPDVEAPTMLSRIPESRFGMSEAVFPRRDSNILSAEVRAVVLSWLAPTAGDIIWDICCGSGAVGIEAASSGAAVFSVDMGEEQVVNTRYNASYHNLPVRCVSGDAKKVIPLWARDFPANAAYCSVGDLDIIGTLIEASIPRIVVTLGVLERVSQVIDILEKSGYGVKATQLQANRLERLPTGERRLQGQNPILVIVAERMTHLN